MTISIFGACILLFSLLISGKAVAAIFRQDATSRRTSRVMSRVLLGLVAGIAVLTVAMLRYADIAEWSRSALSKETISLVRKAGEILFGTRSFSLMIQTVLIASSLPVLLVSLYSVVGECISLPFAQKTESLDVVEEPTYRAPAHSDTKTFLTLRQIRI